MRRLRCDGVRRWLDRPACSSPASGPGCRRRRRRARRTCGRRRAARRRRPARRSRRRRPRRASTRTWRPASSAENVNVASRLSVTAGGVESSDGLGGGRVRWRLDRPRVARRRRVDGAGGIDGPHGEACAARVASPEYSAGETQAANGAVERRTRTSPRLTSDEKVKAASIASVVSAGPEVEGRLGWGPSGGGASGVPSNSYGTAVARSVSLAGHATLVGQRARLDATADRRAEHREGMGQRRPSVGGERQRDRGRRSCDRAVRRSCTASRRRGCHPPSRTRRGSPVRRRFPATIVLRKTRSGCDATGKLSIGIRGADATAVWRRVGGDRGVGDVQPGVGVEVEAAAVEPGDVARDRGVLDLGRRVAAVEEATAGDRGSVAGERRAARRAACCRRGWRTRRPQTRDVVGDPRCRRWRARHSPGCRCRRRARRRCCR